MREREREMLEREREREEEGKTEGGGCGYRRLLSSVRRALALPEVLMCAQEWSEIDMSHVPSLAMSRYKRAFLNEGKGRSTEDPERAACLHQAYLCTFVPVLETKPLQTPRPIRIQHLTGDERI
jgi:hypothetical protein